MGEWRDDGVVQRYLAAINERAPCSVEEVADALQTSDMVACDVVMHLLRGRLIVEGDHAGVFELTIAGREILASWVARAIARS